uniref:Uncharacterized protein n=1 Tax=Knipowitschia caucasica TaxID=637954 RepID=A0AAV2M444_KNICA
MKILLYRLQGEKGDRGDKGERGRDGVDGRKGEPGRDGLAGRDGIRGPEGRPGPPGPSGPIDPSARLKGEKGERGFPGIDGSSGLPGRPGSPGSAGVPGSQGLPGVRGAPVSTTTSDLPLFHSNTNVPYRTFHEPYRTENLVCLELSGQRETKENGENRDLRCLEEVYQEGKENQASREYQELLVDLGLQVHPESPSRGRRAAPEKGDLQESAVGRPSRATRAPQVAQDFQDPQAQRGRPDHQAPRVTRGRREPVCLDLQDDKESQGTEVPVVHKGRLAVRETAVSLESLDQRGTGVSEDQLERLVIKVYRDPAERPEKRGTTARPGSQAEAFKVCLERKENRGLGGCLVWMGVSLDREEEEAEEEERKENQELADLRDSPENREKRANRVKTERKETVGNQALQEELDSQENQ